MRHSGWVTTARHPFLEHDGPLAMVHRGGAAEAHENSLAAFQRAVDLGYRYVETDVQATSDGVLLAFHDRHLDRVTDSSGRISELPFAAVARARIGGTEPIPLLGDLLTSFPDVRFNIDSKHPSTLRPLVEVLRRTNALHRVCLASFSDRRLGWLRSALGPKVCSALGPREVAGLKLASVSGRHMRWLRRRLPATALAVQVPAGPAALPLVDRRFVDTAHRLGLSVHIWTVDTAPAMERLLDLGVDGIMTDRPEVLRSVLQRRGLWPGARNSTAR
jgi:glycerophosphoryl diester phosphodiesterase